MAKFIEYKTSPGGLPLSWCLGGVISLLAVILFLKGVVSTIGFVVILACGIGVLFFLNEQVERRSGIVTEVASGKLPNAHRRLWTTPFWSSGKTPLVELRWSLSPALRVLDLSPLPTRRRGLGLRLDPLLLHLHSSSFVQPCSG